MASGALEYEHWSQLQERTKEAWRDLVRQHGFDPSDVAFPLVIEGDTMIVRQYLRNERGRLYFNEDRTDAAVQYVEVKLRTEVGLPAICRA